MRTFVVGSREHARAVVHYAADINCRHAESESENEKGWYLVKVRCNNLQFIELKGFVAGLGWIK